MNTEKFNLLPYDDLSRKLERIRKLLAEAGLDSLFVADNVNKYYLTGRMFSGFIYIDQNIQKWFVKRPTYFRGEDVVLIRKVENITDTIDPAVIGKIGFELNHLSYADAQRYIKAFGQPEFGNGDDVLMAARSVKTDYEIELIKKSSDRLADVYSRVPSLFRPGMTDVDLQIEIETVSRKLGCLGIFRINGQEMELNMGSVLVGDNADAPSPYDFAMGGAGVDPSLPVGANGTRIKSGNTVMVDTNGCFTGYMTDMTRTFVFGTPSPEAVKAHQLSIDICNRLAEMGKPGVAASELYNEALRMAEEANLQDRFMGHRSQAGFVGHGVGIVINELPVLAPRSRNILQVGNVIAIEPKFVIDGVGAVGIENTYVVTDDGMKRLTEAPEHLIQLEQ